MRKLIAAGVVAAVAGGMALPAFAASGRGSIPPVMTGSGSPNCKTTENNFGEPGGSNFGSSGQTVCVSPSGVLVSSWSTGSTSVSSGTAPSGVPGQPPAIPEPPLPDAGPIVDDPQGALEDEVEKLLDLIDPGRGTTDPAADPDEEEDPIRELLNRLGIKTYEDKVCDDRHDGYTASDGEYVQDYLVDEYATDYLADCWVDDYLLGDYVSNYLLDYVDDAVPMDLGPVKTVARDLISTVRHDVTNGTVHDVLTQDVGSTAPPAVPSTLPAVPGVGRPAIPPGLPAQVQSLLGL